MSDGGRLTTRSSGAWTDRTLRARISDGRAKLRHPCGSPDPREIAAYRSLLPTRRRLAVVLGMTPELRAMAAGEFDLVLALDVSAAAVALYRDWVDAAFRGSESVVRANWLDLAALIGAGRPVDAVLGDGVFGNLAPAEHEPMLEQVRAVLAPGGLVVLRQALVPAGTVVAGRGVAGPPRPSPQRIARRCRAGLRGPAARPPRLLLGRPPARQRRPLRGGRPAGRGRVLAAGPAGCHRALPLRREHGPARRGRLGAALVAGSGFALREQPLSGRDWYRYYPVQQLTPSLTPRQSCMITAETPPRTPVFGPSGGDGVRAARGDGGRRRRGGVRVEQVDGRAAGAAVDQVDALLGADEGLDGARAAQLAQAALEAVGEEHVPILGTRVPSGQSKFRGVTIRKTDSQTVVPPSWDTRQLVALLAVVDTGTFSAAALELGYTQSAVSQQVASLERQIGAPLLFRAPAGRGGSG